jgi:RimJ/RimL family protein N-acetyltransferase
VAGELLRQPTAWALDELGAGRIVLIVDGDTVASQRVAGRGSTLWGVLRSPCLKARVRSAAEQWSRLPSDESRA